MTEKINPADAIRLLDAHEAVAVDVREPDEYAVGHIPGAKLLPLGQVLTRAAEVLPDKNAVWLVYCRTGRRSADAVQKLESLGYTNLRDLGGILSRPLHSCPFPGPPGLRLAVALLRRHLPALLRASLGSAALLGVPGALAAFRPFLRLLTASLGLRAFLGIRTRSGTILGILGAASAFLGLPGRPFLVREAEGLRVILACQFHFSSSCWIFPLFLRYQGVRRLTCRSCSCCRCAGRRR